MWETDQPQASLRGARRSQQRGAAAVEFAVIAVAFFMFLFGIMELARIVYMYNTLAEATRGAAKAASNIDFKNTGKLDTARQQAIFRTTSGELVIGKPITEKNIVIDYLSLERQGSGALVMQPIPTGSLPACPSRNRQNCLENPYSSSCIRLVRVRVCSVANNNCERVTYEPIFWQFSFGGSLPNSTTIVTAETLGYSAGDALCP